MSYEHVYLDVLAGLAVDGVGWLSIETFQFVMNNFDDALVRQRGLSKEVVCSNKFQQRT